MNLDNGVISLTDFDVVICGGGMIGTAMALRLAPLGLTIALVEAKQPQAFAINQAFDLRVSAISPQSRGLLEQCGAWSMLENMRMCPYQYMRVWELAGFGDLTFAAKDVKVDNLGYIIENRLLQLSLWHNLAQWTNIELICPAKPVQINRLAKRYQITLDTQQQLHAKLLIGADGGQSVVRQSCGIGVNSSQYEQACLVASVATEIGQQDITWQRFTSTGPQAFLPLPGQHGSLVWYHQAEQIREMKDWSNQQVAMAISAAFPTELGSFSVLNKGHFRLQKQHAQAYTKQGVALIGDAAHMINPLAGQGVNLGFQDVACLAQLIQTALSQNQLWHSQQVLQQYARQRRLANGLMMTTMDFFYHTFNNQRAPLKWIRNGILAGAAVPAIKHHVIRYAMGQKVLPKPFAFLSSG